MVPLYCYHIWREASPRHKTFSIMFRERPFALSTLHFFITNFCPYAAGMQLETYLFYRYFHHYYLDKLASIIPLPFPLDQLNFPLDQQAAQDHRPVVPVNLPSSLMKKVCETILFVACSCYTIAVLHSVLFK